MSNNALHDLILKKTGSLRACALSVGTAVITIQSIIAGTTKPRRQLHLALLQILGEEAAGLLPPLEETQEVVSCFVPLSVHQKFVALAEKRGIARATLASEILCNSIRNVSNDH